MDLVTAPKYKKQSLTEMKRKIDNLTVMVGRLHYATFSNGQNN